MMKNKKGKPIIRHDSKKEYLDTAIRIRNDFHRDPLGQIKEWENQPSEFRVLGFAEVVQFLASTSLIERGTVQLSTGQIDLLYRAILDLARHLQEHLPDGVYDYNYFNLNDVSKNIISQIIELDKKR
jgi:hypothetical protein